MKNILLAEDDRNFAFILKQELEDNDYAVDVVHDGVEAVLHFISGPYDFILLDIQMPRLAGIDALRIIRKPDPHIPTITFSGEAVREEVEAADTGCLKFLAKPFPVADLKKNIRDFFGKTSPGCKPAGDDI